MGTRGLIGFVINGEVKTAYNHFDSYPEGLGLDALKYAKNMNLSISKMAAEALIAVDDSVAPTEEQMDRLAEYYDPSVGGPSVEEDWYRLLRHTQGDIGATLTAGYYIDAADFALDSLFCEWGYVLNFDTNELEVYEGFNQGSAVGIWADKSGKREYTPITLIKSFSLDNLPEDEVFLKEVKANSRYPDDEED